MWECTIILEYAKKDPTRDPAWRWHFANRQSAKSADVVADGGDKWLAAAISLVRGQKHRAGTERAKRSRNIAKAHEIYQNNNEIHWELEARILAGERYAAIAEKLNIRLGVIKAYQNVFFDVKPRLKHGDYIHNVVIGTHRPWEPTRVRDLWCYFAFTGGFNLLDYIISDYRAVGKPDYSHLIDGTPRDPQRSTTGKKFDRSLRMMFFPVNEKTLVALIHMRIELMAAEKRFVNPLSENGFGQSVDLLLDEVYQEIRNDSQVAGKGAAGVGVA